MLATVPKLTAKDIVPGIRYRLAKSGRVVEILSRVDSGIWSGMLDGREVTILLADIAEEFTGTDRQPCAPLAAEPPTSAKSTTAAARSHQLRDGKLLACGGDE